MFFGHAWSQWVGLCIQNIVGNAEESALKRINAAKGDRASPPPKIHWTLICLFELWLCICVVIKLCWNCNHRLITFGRSHPETRNWTRTSLLLATCHVMYLWVLYWDARARCTRCRRCKVNCCPPDLWLSSRILQQQQQPRCWAGSRRVSASRHWTQLATNAFSSLLNWLGDILAAYSDPFNGTHLWRRTVKNAAGDSTDTHYLAEFAFVIVDCINGSLFEAGSYLGVFVMHIAVAFIVKH